MVRGIEGEGSEFAFLEWVDRPAASALRVSVFIGSLGGSFTASLPIFIIHPAATVINGIGKFTSSRKVCTRHPRLARRVVEGRGFEDPDEEQNLPITMRGPI